MLRGSVREPVLDVWCVGALGIPNGPGLFDRADLILQSRTGQLFYGRYWRRIEERETVEGNVLPADDFEALVEAGEAMRWPRKPFRVGPQSAVWHLRAQLPERNYYLQELITRAAVLQRWETEEGGWSLAVNEQAAAGVRQAWADSLEAEAERELARAEARVRAAYLVQPRPTSKTLALMRVALPEGEQLVAMEERSRQRALERAQEEAPDGRAE